MVEKTIGLRRSGLMLTRRPGESIMIGDDVEVTVTGLNGNQVRILISAPREIIVHRSEVYARIQSEREREAARQQSEPITNCICRSTETVLYHPDCPVHGAKEGP